MTKTPTTLYLKYLTRELELPIGYIAKALDRDSCNLSRRNSDGDSLSLDEGVKLHKALRRRFKKLDEYFKNTIRAFMEDEDETE